MVDVLYSEPDGSAVLGSFLHHTIDDVPKTPKQIKARKKESELKECEKPESSTSVKCKDIVLFSNLLQQLKIETRHQQQLHHPSFE